MTKKRFFETLRYMSGFWFVLYLILLSYFLFFCEAYGRTDITTDLRYNLVPLREIRRFIVYYKEIGIKNVIMNLGGNILLFVPFGIGLPALNEKNEGFIKIAIWTFGFSLVLELTQLVCHVGAFDVDDLLLNTLGGILGYALLCLARRCLKRGNKAA